MQGVMIQMFNHGINILGMWIVVDLIERQFQTRKISELGGLGAEGARSGDLAGDRGVGEYRAAADECLYRGVPVVQRGIHFDGYRVQCGVYGGGGHSDHSLGRVYAEYDHRRYFLGRRMR